MRLFGLLLCVSACTLENPAFFVTDGASATGDSSTDPTRPTSSTSAPTSTTAASAATTDESGTTDPATTANVSNSDVTTDPPATSSTTTTDATTSTTDSQPMTATSSDSSGVDTGMSCGFVEFTEPQLPLRVVEDNAWPDTAKCKEWQMQEHVGRLEAAPYGFKVVSDMECGLPLPGGGFVFQLDLGQELPAHNFECIKFRFVVHEGPASCLVSALSVAHAGMPVLLGTFGRTEALDPNMAYKIGFKPVDMCGDCPDCCTPSPGNYAFELQGEQVAQGQDESFMFDGKEHKFRNLRSHVHDECEAPAPDWLHFDWLVLRLQ
ncbi:hypothetical protein [Nannocystis punicea]|uniref:Uncharacterized protein n=1 Tax=Nannocystis punicea TaxID=2995304 RepID=A0ABY7H8C7_9BACT|nr:hypothetical protein [Nannocystis poenicansa]WAS95518.1 hypothetical protein O0S08_05095 [Nannocystis poenicansa]